ncbi:hypothetical protein NSS82_10360 [Paenibacillus sp. FSL H7-0735]|uniref:hypothetical protein n=1 Tax=Paenibacillus sp. FSL H7-0735 TaxID=2954736 RepID=UPI0030F7D3C8
MSEFVLHKKRESLSLTILILLFIMPLALLFMASPKDSAAFVITALTIFSIFVVKDFHQSKKVFIASLFVLISHHAIAFVNAFFFATPGSEADAIVFHDSARIISEVGVVDLNTNGSRFFVNFLALCYKTFGESHLLGMELSVAAFFLSMVVLLKILKLAGVTHNNHLIILMYGLLPTSLMFTSITLRESWQILFFSLVVFFSIKLKFTKKFIWLLFLILSMSGLSLWHNGFVAILPFLLFITILWSFRSNKKKSLVLDMFIFVFAVGIIILSFNLLGGSSAGSALSSGNALEYVEQYRSNSNLGTGASYVSSINFSGPIGTLLNIPIMFLGYMFAPYPWQIRGAMDIYAFSESMFRLLLLIAALKTWKNSTGKEKGVYGFLLVVFLLIEGLWSLGTSNWGTAMRHHLVAYGILLTVGGPRLCSSIKSRLVKIVK